MTNNEFLTLWNDLCGHYNYKEAANVRIINAYSKACAEVAVNKCGSLFSDILSECERFPSLGKFEDVCRRYLPTFRKSKYVNSEKCMYCLDLGSIITEDNVSYACPKCNMGKKFLYQNFMPYDKKFGSEALEALKEKNENYVPVPIEVSKAKFFEAISRWNVKML